MNATLQAGIPIRIDSGQLPVYRLLCGNPGQMTGPGTNSYLLGRQRMALVDPGPALPEHREAILSALAGRELAWIFVTHTHGDHSPGAAELQRLTGAELIGLPAPAAAHQDDSFVPDRSYRHEERIRCDDFVMQLIHTPGHVSNHFCFLLEEERLLFTGDHVLQGTTPVILPPDGDMADYLDSLEKLRLLDLRALAPGHGTVIDTPEQSISALIRHRLRRESKVLRCMGELGASPIEALCRAVYDDVPEQLLGWAQKTLLAHLIKLEKESRVRQERGLWVATV